MAQILSPINSNTPADFDPFAAFEDFEDPFETSSDTSEKPSVVSEDSDEGFDNPFEEADLVSETSDKAETPEQTTPTQEKAETGEKVADTTGDSPAQEKQPEKPQLHADNPTEQRLLDYFIENAGEVLMTKTLAGKKTIQGAYSFISGEARKQATGGCAMVEDSVVFGWLIHYFEEDSLDCEPKPVVSKPKAAKTPAKKATPAKPAAPITPSSAPKPTPKPAPEPKDEPLDIFSLFGGN